jgi:hypothetical protein
VLISVDDSNFFEIETGLPRSYASGELVSSMTWNGTFADGSFVPPASYRLALRGLKMLAPNESDPDSWATYITPSFILQFNASDEAFSSKQQ